MLKLILLISTPSLTAKAALVQKGVYWREYDGSIPEDAVQTGVGLYIGQVVIEKYLVPGTIDPETQMFYSEYNGKFKRTDDIRILCSKNPQRLQWELIDMNSSTDGLLKRAVEGGYQNEKRFHIGRIYHEDEWRIGKVDFGPLRCLLVWNSDDSTYKVKQFEVLTYV